ncbi:hypothetical protein AUJ65_00020 [Candidatus Micrarchaeota archaeon CG1_02_51_15]|nr:MAG: hypothetical protein AUJ65_00020 [Candidatus Micrarchaeota archaeon CG1_02_51_15]
MPILLPRKEQEIISLLEKVPAGKRKIVLFVGRHPIEQTVKLIMPCMLSKLDGRGVTVMRCPSSFTPNYFWKHARPLVEEGRAREALELLPPADWEIADLVNERFGIPSVNIHRNPDSYFRLG